jgi:hypothetical protein
MNRNEGYIYRKGMSPETRTVISTKNKIYAKPSGQDQFLQIGVVASFEPSDSRSVDPIRGIGYGDQIAELIPNASDPISISVTRSALYLSLLMQTFGYNAGVDGLVRALKHHRWPFDIKQEIVFSEIASEHLNGAQGTRPASENGLRALITVYEACWMTSYNVSFSSDTSLVQENCEIQCSDIIDGKSNYEQYVVAGSTDTGNNPFTGTGSVRYSNASRSPIVA